MNEHHMSERLANLMGKQPVSWSKVDRGYTPAGLPLIPSAPRVRDVQLQQLRVALPWAARVLGLPPLGQG